MFIFSFILILIIIGLLYFNRPPPSISFQFHPNDIVSPADGVIKEIKRNVIISNKKYNMIHIYIGLHNIHTQVYPSNGTILSAEYYPTGIFKDARTNTDRNEKLDTRLSNGIIIRQIAGILARRIYAFDTVGTYIRRGDSLGKITLGSGCQLYLPTDQFEISNNAIIGANVSVGKTVLATAINIHKF